MLMLISPAKKLLTPDKPYQHQVTNPLFPEKTEELAKILKQLNATDLARLMKISAELAKTNHHRFQLFEQSLESYPAIFLFRGDVYKSLDVDEWDKSSLDFSQSHLRILSGMYGLLRPLDLIQPYRLEMGTTLANSCGKNLYDYWKLTVTTELNNQIASHARKIVLNLASTEYSSVVDTKLLKAPLVTVHFKEKKGPDLKVIGIHAKRARGAMARYVSQHQLDDIDSVRAFDVLNYQYVETQSDENNLVFVR
jgi:cytoplasmic iron level regulating protein YaaA (DUF328/UPF0246 family)